MIKEKFIITLEYDTNNPIDWIQFHDTVSTDILKAINKSFVKNSKVKTE